MDATSRPLSEGAFRRLINAAPTLRALGSKPRVDYDIVDVGRQLLARQSTVFATDLRRALVAADAAAAAAAGEAMLRVLDDMDALLATHEGFLLGPWLQSAKMWAGRDDDAAVAVERSARSLISSWGPSGSRGGDGVQVELVRSTHHGLKGVTRFQIVKEMNYNCFQTYAFHITFNSRRYRQGRIFAITPTGSGRECWAAAATLAATEPAAVCITADGSRSSLGCGWRWSWAGSRAGGTKPRGRWRTPASSGRGWKSRQGGEGVLHFTTGASLFT